MSNTKLQNNENYSLMMNRVFVCSGMSFPDLMVRQGVIDNPPKTPLILGFECAGEVEAVGENVTDFSVSIN